MKPVILHPEADQELTDAAVWYDQQRSGLGSRYLDAVDAGLQHLAENPECGTIVDDLCRMLRISRFPYGLIFRDRMSETQVIAVHHLSRDTEYWGRRMADVE